MKSFGAGTGRGLSRFGGGCDEGNASPTATYFFQVTVAAFDTYLSAAVLLKTSLIRPAGVSDFFRLNLISFDRHEVHSFRQNAMFGFDSEENMFPKKYGKWPESCAP